MKPDVLLGLVLAVAGLILAAPALVRASSLSLRFMLALTGVGICLGLAVLGPVSSDVSGVGKFACGTILAPHDQTPEGIYSSCGSALSSARWEIGGLLAFSALAAASYGYRLRRDSPRAD
jgi:hypothetical protein